LLAPYPLFFNQNKRIMLTKFVQFSQSSALRQKLHRRKLFALFFSSLPLLAAGAKDNANTMVEPIKNKGYGKGAYGG
jgi:hypothetical protein